MTVGTWRGKCSFWIASTQNSRARRKKYLNNILDGIQCGLKKKTLQTPWHVFPSSYFICLVQKVVMRNKKSLVWRQQNKREKYIFVGQKSTDCEINFHPLANSLSKATKWFSFHYFSCGNCAWSNKCHCSQASRGVCYAYTSYLTFPKNTSFSCVCCVLLPLQR